MLASVQVCPCYCFLMEARNPGNSSVGLAEVADALQTLVLPLLDARTLCCLACTSTTFKEWVYGSPVPVWEAAARRDLPRPYPLPQPSIRQSIQQALRAHAEGEWNQIVGINFGAVWRSTSSP
ncbi:hypothetical protein WJX73_000903 [Symbiochloris irregularis]|uniref:F-box domain-containing protein n=1 Tax=Symbiochloris irregularis TaxID=706552 RepID=A0AAW1PXW0_9CHLO